ncbi:hypothetical protein HYZ98_00615 [Candidatus Peregrinibacteria bacterium]|nr:hypothetical protein [Candidatus Peregrinibacteria bacterium]
MRPVHRIVCVIFSLCLPGFVAAQENSDVEVSLDAEAQLEAALPELPDPGITPDSPFFIVEQLIETIGDTLTFNAEAKAKRQGERALERIAEVKAMLAESGVSPRGLSVALQKIEDHASKAASNAKDPSLAKKIDSTLEVQNVLLKKIIDEKKRQLHAENKERKHALHRQLMEKLLTRADDEAQNLENELSETDTQTEAFEILLDEALNSTENALQEQEKVLEQSLDETDRQREEFEHNVRAAMKERKKVLHMHLKELRTALNKKEHALKEQLKEAIELGEDEEIEHLTAEFSASVQTDAALQADVQVADTLVTGGEADVEVFLLQNTETDLAKLMEHERSFLDQVSQGADLVFKVKRKAHELRLDAEEKALNLKGKKLGHEIVKRRQECLDMNVQNLGQCIAERARALQTDLEQVALEEKVVAEEQENLSEESNAEERQFDESLMMRKRALETFQSLKNSPERLLDASQKFSERASEAEQQWQEKRELLKEERRTNEEGIRERMKEGKEAIRTEWKEFLKTDFDPKELKMMQEERRMEQKDLLEGAKEERTEVREEFKEGMGEIKEERKMMKEEMKEERPMMKEEIREERPMMKDKDSEERSEKQRMKEEEMRMFIEKRDQLLKEERKEMDKPTETSYPPENRGEDMPVKQLIPRYPSRDIPDRRPEETRYKDPPPTDRPSDEKSASPSRPTDEKPPPPKRPADEKPPPPRRDEGQSGETNIEGRGEVKGDVQSDNDGPRGGVQFEFEEKWETTGDSY